MELDKQHEISAPSFFQKYNWPLGTTFYKYSSYLAEIDIYTAKIEGEFVFNGLKLAPKSLISYIPKKEAWTVVPETDVLYKNQTFLAHKVICLKDSTVYSGDEKTGCDYRK